MLHAYLVKIELQYQKADNQENIINRKRLLAWRYKYSIKVQKYCEDGYLIVCLVFHAILLECFGLMIQNFVLYSPSRGKRVVMSHAGSSKAFVENSFLLCRKLPFTLWEKRIKSHMRTTTMISVELYLRISLRTR